MRMAAVVRVKRRRCEDPVDRLVIACKKQKSALYDNEDEEPLVKEVFKFAGTVNGKDEGLRSQLKEAIRKEKLTREYKVHIPADQKVAVRSTLVTHAKEGRFQLTLAHRAIDCASSVEEGTGVASAVSEATAGSDQQDQILCLYDAVIHEATYAENTGATEPPSLTSEAAVTCNGLPMVKQKCELSPSDCSSSRIAALESEFVYDIYYTNKKGLDLSLLESALQVEGFTDEFLYDRGADDYRDVYEDEDDSNDESNWRNDYPDEDPHFYDDSSGSGHEGQDDFDRDPLLDYFTAKCDLDAPAVVSSDDADDDDDDDDAGRVSATAAILSYAKHKQELMRELEISGSDQSENESGDDVDT